MAHSNTFWRAASVVGAVLLLSTVLLIAPHPASASVIVVDGVICTLADAITAANFDIAVGGCPPGYGPDTLDLQTDVTLTVELPAVTSEIVLLGNGHTVERLPTAASFRLLTVASLDGVTVDQYSSARRKRRDLRRDPRHCTIHVDE